MASKTNIYNKIISVLSKTIDSEASEVSEDSSVYIHGDVIPSPGPHACKTIVVSTGSCNEAFVNTMLIMRIKSIINNNDMPFAMSKNYSVKTRLEMDACHLNTYTLTVTEMFNFNAFKVDKTDDIPSSLRQFHVSTDDYASFVEFLSKVFVIMEELDSRGVGIIYGMERIEWHLYEKFDSIRAIKDKTPNEKFMECLSHLSDKDDKGLDVNVVFNTLVVPDPTLTSSKTFASTKGKFQLFDYMNERPFATHVCTGSPGGMPFIDTLLPHRYHSNTQHQLAACATIAAVISSYARGGVFKVLTPSQMAHMMMFRWFYGYANPESEEYDGRWSKKPVRPNQNIMDTPDAPQTVVMDAFKYFKETESKHRDLGKDVDTEYITACESLMGISSLFAAIINKRMENDTAFNPQIDALCNSTFETFCSEVDLSLAKKFVNPTLSCAEYFINLLKMDRETVKRRPYKTMDMFETEKVSIDDARRMVTRWMGAVGGVLLHVDKWLVPFSEYCKTGDIFLVRRTHYEVQHTIEMVFEDLNGVVKAIDEQRSDVMDADLFIPIRKHTNKKRGQKIEEVITEIAGAYPVGQETTLLFIAKGWTDIVKGILFQHYERLSGYQSNTDIPIYPIVCRWVLPVVREIAAMALELVESEGVMSACERSKQIHTFMKHPYEVLHIVRTTPEYGIAHLEDRLTFGEKYLCVLAHRVMSMRFSSDKMNASGIGFAHINNTSFQAAIGLVPMLVELFGEPEAQKREWEYWQQVCAKGPIDHVSGWDGRSLFNNKSKNGNSSLQKTAFSPLFEMVRVVAMNDSIMEWKNYTHLWFVDYLSKLWEGRTRDLHWWLTDDSNVSAIQAICGEEKPSIMSPEYYKEEVFPIAYSAKTCKALWSLIFDPSFLHSLRVRILCSTQLAEAHSVNDRKYTRFCKQSQDIYEQLFPHLVTDPLRKGDVCISSDIARAKNKIIEHMYGLASGPPADTTQSKCVDAIYFGGVLPVTSLQGTWIGRVNATGARSLGLYYEKQGGMKLYPTKDLANKAKSFKGIKKTYIKYKRAAEESKTSQKKTNGSQQGGGVSHDVVECAKEMVKDDFFVSSSEEEETGDSEEDGSVEQEESDEEEEEQDICYTSQVVAKETHEGDTSSDEWKSITFSHRGVLDAAKATLKRAHECSAEYNEMHKKRRVSTKIKKGEGEERNEEGDISKYLYKSYASALIRLFMMMERGGNRRDRELSLDSGLEISEEMIMDPTIDLPCQINERLTKSAAPHLSYMMYDKSIAMARTHPTYTRIVGDAADKTIANLMSFWFLRKMRCYK